MFDKEAIQELQMAASTYQAENAVKAAMDSKGIAALPDKFTVHDLEKHMPLRRRARGLMETDVLESFAAYTLDHAEAGATVFVNTDDMSATAVLNLGTPAAPLHADNKARLLSRQTAAYKALRNIANGGGQKQAVVAEFLEDWAGMVKCFSPDGELSPPKAIAAIRKVTIETLRKLESEEQQLSASVSAFESVKASSKEALPTTVYFTCQPYKGFAERTFVLRLAVLTNSDKPAIGLRVVKQEEHDEQMAQELAERVGHAVAGAANVGLSGVPVLLGSYRAAS